MHLRGPKNGRSPVQRRGSSAEAAISAETTRLGSPNTANGENSLSYYKPTKEGDVQFKGVLELKATDIISPKPHSDVWLQ
ncbi:hypothetical protein BBO99_00004669 [Phytophthora kernoviae]|uniref:Uncharacterized protein n=2 Tax=Phytophthora kernoviae TaxID=325452 RepID=A0A3R7MWJ0_9STRA|nr:hypothetical protein G195_008540 [Phytophthora kernoviae 00238/432]KAG2521154.1 hypothetical protein JM16_004350 [Phytophthora kernoviae]KAG2522353.1 hypothetical protein JM18_003908 [Phytophthora kernoviae]RLN45223.1 hypothetical protein BBI17_007191 [Phytophthora kernoviae]RLN80223.1 hypothetical protein BBO99_00004669 [Phytophthora kernoviae]